MAKKHRTQKPSQSLPGGGSSSPVLRYYPILLIAVIGIIAYSNSFDCSFHFDDYAKIVDNKAIRNVADLSEIWNFKNRRAFINTRFVGFLTFALNYRFNGLDVFGYHAVNLAIHIVTSLLVWWLVLLTFSTPVVKKSPIGSRGDLIALGSALIFLTHPLQTQSVTYIVQRLASLASLFYLASLCLYVKARLSTAKTRSRFYLAGAAITAVLGFFTKEITFTLPFAILLYEICFFYTGAVRSLLTGKRIAVCFAVAAIAAIFFSTLLSFKFNEIFIGIPSQRSGDPLLTPSIYFVTQFKVIVKYLQLVLVPVGLNIDHDLPASRSFFEPATMGGFLVLAALLIGVLWLFPRKRVVAFGILWFFLTISVESSFKPLHNVIFEHRLYLPMVGLSLSAAAVLGELLPGNTFMIAICAITAIYSIGTFQRNRVWKDDLTLWSDAMRKSPNRERPHYNLGLALYKSKNIDGAIAEYTKAININPNHTNAHNNLGEIYVNLRRYDDGIREYREALKSNPDFYIAYNNIGNAFLVQGKLEEALDAYKKALGIVSSYPIAHNNMGRTLFFMGRIDEAVNEYNAALIYDPDYGTAHCNLGEALLSQGKNDEGIRHLREAIRINPGDRRARELLREFQKSSP